ncbi:MAG: hypothetical protein IKN71_01070 [Alphaproteobacteria bacterium]|jgi:hypothetical protein|nr:hypothetical protein [Alphaproteobacteria bacterium]
MENQYYTLMEKQDFFEIIENKYGELAIFIDARDGEPQEPLLQFDGKKTALLKRDERRSIILDNVDVETKGVLAESEVVMIVELHGEMVVRVYAVPVENVEDIVLNGRRTRADEVFRAKSKDELLKSFGAVKTWTGGMTK